MSLLLGVLDLRCARHDGVVLGFYFEFSGWVSCLFICIPNYLFE